MKTHCLVKWMMILSCTLIIGFLDWLTGYELNFFVFYFVPVSLAAWRLGLVASHIVAVLNAVVWLVADVWSGHAYSSAVILVWNTVIRLCSFVAIGWSVWRIRGLLILEREKAEALQHSISQIKILEGLLPTCAQCKKIRNSEGQWEQMEVYIQHHSNAQFSHGFCPDCARAYREELKKAFPSMGRSGSAADETLRTVVDPAGAAMGPGNGSSYS